MAEGSGPNYINSHSDRTERIKKWEEDHSWDFRPMRVKDYLDFDCIDKYEIQIFLDKYLFHSEDLGQQDVEVKVEDGFIIINAKYAIGQSGQRGHCKEIRQICRKFKLHPCTKMYQVRATLNRNEGVLTVTCPKHGDFDNRGPRNVPIDFE